MNKLINTKHCKFSVVDNAANSIGLSVSKEEINIGSSDFDIWWHDEPSKCTKEHMKQLKSHQKVNHFPAMSELAIKTQLGRNLNRMKLFFPEQYDFHPLTFVLPKDTDKLNQFKSSHPNSTLIMKPSVSAEGRRIIISSADSITTEPGAVVQQYIPNPLLIDGFKFDLRLYVLITKVEPLCIYLFEDGLVRFCTDPYQIPTIDNFSNKMMHLTNYTVNKENNDFVANDKKKSFLWFLQFIAEQKNTEISQKLLNDIKTIIAKTVIGNLRNDACFDTIAAQPTLASLNKSLFSADSYQNAAFELLGFDILVDENLKPWILEINQSMSLSTDTDIDLKIKSDLVENTLKLVLGEESAKYMKVYPTEDYKKYDKLFCFPFPEELFSGNFLNNNECNQLLSLIKQ